MNDAVKFFINQPDGCQFYNEKTNRIEQIPGWIEYETIFLKLLDGDYNICINSDASISALLENPIISEDSLIKIVESILVKFTDEKNNIIRWAIKDYLDNVIHMITFNPNVTERFLDKYRKIITNSDLLRIRGCEEYILQDQDTMNKISSLLYSDIRHGNKTRYFTEDFYTRFHNTRNINLMELIDFSNPHLSLKFYHLYIFPIQSAQIQNRFLTRIYSDEILTDFLEGHNDVEYNNVFYNPYISPEIVYKIMNKTNMLPTIGIKCKLSVELFFVLFEMFKTDDDDNYRNCFCLLTNIIDPNEKLINFLEDYLSNLNYEEFPVVYKIILYYLVNYHNDIDRLFHNFDLVISYSNKINILPTEYNETMQSKNIMHCELLAFTKGLNEKTDIRTVKSRKLTINFNTGLFLNSLNMSPKYLERNIKYLTKTNTNMEELLKNTFCLNKRVANNNFKRMRRNITQVTVDSILYRPGNSGFQQSKEDFERKL